MTQYINKADVIAEIEKTEKLSKSIADKQADKFWQIHYDGWVTACRSLLSFINSLEVKEVDLEKEIEQFLDTYFPKAKLGHKLSLRRTAKHFFELGLKVRKGE